MIRRSALGHNRRSSCFERHGFCRFAFDATGIDQRQPRFVFRRWLKVEQATCQELDIVDIDSHEVQSGFPFAFACFAVFDFCRGFLAVVARYLPMEADAVERGRLDDQFAGCRGPRQLTGDKHDGDDGNFK